MYKFIVEDNEQVDILVEALNEDKLYGKINLSEPPKYFIYLPFQHRLREVNEFVYNEIFHLFRELSFKGFLRISGLVDGQEFLQADTDSTVI